MDFDGIVARTRLNDEARVVAGTRAELSNLGIRKKTAAFFHQIIP